MGVSLEEEDAAPQQRSARARTQRLMLETATRLMQRGETPSVSSVAEAAGVSRATAYRYFPSQAALVQSVVGEALGPILGWNSDFEDPEQRVSDLIASSLPRIREFEATFKAALKLNLEQWARHEAGTLGEEPAFKRGHRVALLQDAIAPLRTVLPEGKFLRLAQALSLVYGLESLIVLKDIWGLAAEEVETTAIWAGRAMVRQAIAEATAPAARPPKETTGLTKPQEMLA